jgi:tetratricopeptide (TPR) repeat protein
MRFPRTAVPSLAAVLLLTLAAATAGAQERFQWPEHPKNLKVLPEDTTTQQLRQTMFAFTSALGVRCDHCHVGGGPGKHLSDMDFASDDNPAKETAREMMRMAHAINEDYLSKVKPSTPPLLHVGCATCHPGVARPQPLDQLLGDVVAADGVEAAVTRYHELREKYYGGAAYDFSPEALNNLGYRLLGDGKVDDAIAILRLNAETFPDSANAYDSLAEAYLKKGDRVRAEAFYQRSLELDPGNDNAVRQLEKLRAGGVEPAMAPPGGR